MRCPKCNAGNSKRATECSQCGAAIESKPETSVYTTKERKYAHQSHAPWPGLGKVDKPDPVHVAQIVADLHKKLGR